MILEIELDPRRVALLRGLAGYNGETLTAAVASMIDDNIDARLEGANHDAMARLRKSAPPPPVRVKIKR